MEMTQFEREINGVIYKLPIGFRFRPTDEELVVHYLTRKVSSQPLPVAVIPDLDVFRLNPWDLPGELKERRYFFCKKKMNLMGKCSHHFSTGGGRWKGSSKIKQILGNNNVVIGMKKWYVFHRAATQHRDGVKTEWVLQEFCVVAANGCSPPPPHLNNKKKKMKMVQQVGEWVACRLYQRKTREWRNFSQTNSFLSGSSGVTQISCNDLDVEVISPPPPPLLAD